MANPLLDRAAPEQLARNRQAFEIVENLSTFEQLAAIVAADLGTLGADNRPVSWRDTPVRVALQFGWADAREVLPQLTGTVQTRVPAVCQRCLQPCEIPLDLALALLLLGPDAVQTADVALESWELDEDTLRPLDVVEESLIMALPMVARHDSTSECGTLATGAGEVPAPDTVRPFAGLKARMKGTNDEPQGGSEDWDA
ncbi:MAG: YceD family protein [Woeseiaceae bacterium]|nr:YceD family protein [Woeseiaceae bacterium]